MAGTPGASADYKGHIAGLLTAGSHNIVAYFEFRSGTPTQNNIGRLGSVWACNDDPDLHRSIVAVVRGGGIDYTGAGGDQINGALIMDGNWEATGNFELNGSLVSQGNVHLQSASQQYYMSACWVKNLPGPYFRPVTGHWSEVDR